MFVLGLRGWAFDGSLGVGLVLAQEFEIALNIEDA